MAAIFFDIDGTLWDKENVIPESTREALKLLRENGHQTFLNSGRTKVFINDPNLLSLGFDGILSGCGTYIEYQGKVLFYHKIDEKLMERSIDLFYEYDMPMVIEGRHHLYMDPEIIGKDAYGRYLLEVMKDCTLPIRENKKHLEASKFSIIIENTDYQGLIERLKDHYEFLLHGTTVMEVVPKGFSKATAMEAICSRLQIDPKDTYAFGDGTNDLEMLAYAGTGIAMGNGTDLAKKQADYVTDELHQDGIYNALKHFSLI